jgi:predicted kinase
LEQEVDILIGLPGAGKSYWSEQKIKNFENFACVSRDKIREMLKVNYNFWPFSGSRMWNNLEQQITRLSIEEVLEYGYSLIIDETHISKRGRKLNIDRVRNINSKIKINYIWFTENVNNLKYRMETPKNGSELKWNEVISLMKKSFVEPTIDEIKEFNVNSFIKVSRECGEETVKIS